MENIAFDSHKRYTLCSVENRKGQIIDEFRIEHVRGEIVKHLSCFTAGSPVAVETIGNWYWIVDEIEAAGMVPLLVHARKAKMMMACVNKTDRLDVRGLNRLQRVGSLPTVWIPPRDLRDKRDLARTRMFLVSQRTRLKNRLYATLAKYALRVEGVKDPFCKKGRLEMADVVEQLPPHTRFASRSQLAQVDTLDQQIERLELRMKRVFNQTLSTELLQTMPGIGFLLSVVISLEVGDVSRFGGPDKLAAYAGTTPRVHASGGRVRYGQLRSDVNQYLKWAYVEAAHSICAHRKNHPRRHVSQLYDRIMNKKGHNKAIGAVARHLAESTYWILSKGEKYKQPKFKRVSPTAA